MRQVGIEPDRIEPPEVDETPLPRELPRSYARRLARAKALAVRRRLGEEPAWIIAADTVVACGRRILPKAMDRETAAACLALLSGRRHRVLGGVCVLAPDGRSAERLVTTIVKMKRLSAEEQARYLASEEWHGKAGGYAIQGRAALFVPAINGSYANVVGLPVCEAVALLTGLGWQWPK